MKPYGNWILILVLICCALLSCDIPPIVPSSADAEERNAISDAFWLTYEGNEKQFLDIYTIGDYHRVSIHNVDIEEQDSILEIFSDIQQDATINTSLRPIKVMFYESGDIVRTETLESP